MNKILKDDKVTIAYEYIKNKIVSGEYPPLHDISDIVLQKELAMSRTPIREAIQRLEKDYFVRIYPRKGTLVSELDYNLVNAVYEVRLLNEPYMATQSYNNLSTEWLHTMCDAFKHPPEFQSHDDYVNYYINLDNNFHNTIISKSSNSLLKELLKVVAAHSHRIRLYSTRANRHYTASIEEHIEILDAMLRKDEKGIMETYKKHLHSSLEDALEYLFPKKKQD